KYGYTRAVYIEGGSDQGQDLVLKKDDKIVGIVQCKHSKIKKNHGKETISHELLKILLYMIIDPIKIDSKNIHYLLVISSSFTKYGEEYIKTMKTHFDIKNSELKEELKKVINSYENFKKYFEEECIELILKKVLKNFKRIIFSYEEEQDILLELKNENKGIKEAFFSVKTVVESNYFPIFEGKSNDEILEEKKIEYSSEIFCQRLREIECHEKKVEKAMLHFYKKQNLVTELSIKGIINLEKYLENFENDILEIESSERDCFLMEYEDDKKSLKISEKYYTNFLNTIIKQPITIRRLGETSIDFKCGTIHDLVNEQKIKKWYLGDEE
ncbi:MAG: hypothetical protein ACRCZO_04270, partial [Cetobacterium sp.]